MPSPTCPNLAVVHTPSNHAAREAGHFLLRKPRVGLVRIRRWRAGSAAAKRTTSGAPPERGHFFPQGRIRRRAQQSQLLQKRTPRPQVPTLDALQESGFHPRVELRISRGQVPRASTPALTAIQTRLERRDMLAIEVLAKGLDEASGGRHSIHASYFSDPINGLNAKFVSVLFTAS